MGLLLGLRGWRGLLGRGSRCGFGERSEVWSELEEGQWVMVEIKWSDWVGNRRYRNAFVG